MANSADDIIVDEIGKAVTAFNPSPVSPQTPASASPHAIDGGALFDASPLPAWILDAETFAFLAVNRAATQHYGYSEAEFQAMTLRDVCLPEDFPLFLAQVSRLPFGFEPRGVLRHCKKDGSILFVEPSRQEVEYQGRRGIFTVLNDVTDRIRVENALKASEERLRVFLDTMLAEEETRRFLTKATEALASSLDYERTLQKVADLAVPHIADWCVVDMLEEGNTIRLLAVAHIDPEKVKLAYELRERYPLLPDEPGISAVLRTGQPVILPDIPEELVAVGARDAQHLEMVQQVGLRSVMIVPIVARERILGAITFIATRESGQIYTTKDLTLAEGLAARAALAIDNARLYRTVQEELAQRQQIQDALTQHQAEVEALNLRLQRSMRETHHRVKNNLQVITSLIHMQELGHDEHVPVSELRRLTQHIRSLAAIHDLLTRQAQSDPDVSELSIWSLMDSLMPPLQAMVEGRTLRFEVEDRLVPVQQGTTFAVLVNEIVSNSLKHGAGEILVRFSVTGDQAQIEVLDSGSGFPADFDPHTSANTGLELIHSLARWDLSGSVRFENRKEGGARVVVAFPVS